MFATTKVANMLKSHSRMACNRVIRQRWSELPRIQSIIGLMTSAYIVPVALLSIFPHQEPRFLIPITLPLVFLHSQRIRNVNELSEISEKRDKGHKVFMKKEIVHGYKDKILTLWYLINMSMVLVYGFIHQAGVYPLMDNFSLVMKEKPRLMAVHLVTSFVYPLPVSLLHLKQGRVTTVNQKTGIRYQKTKDFLTYEMGLSDTVENAVLKVKDVVESSEQTWQEKRLKYRVYLAMPTSRLAEFQMIAFKTNLSYTVEQIFYPHISTEALPDFSLGLFTDCDDHSAAVCQASAGKFSLDFIFHYFSHIVHQCGLSLIRIKK